MNQFEEKRLPVLTKDGSLSLFSETYNQHYHSIHGAKQESQHVFIENGLSFFSHLNEISILEIGMGTGLNILVTHDSIHLPKKVHYLALEKFPLSKNEWTTIIPQDNSAFFKDIHESEWNLPIQLSADFFLEKRQIDFLDYKSEPRHHLIYFDAFSPEAQPELWSIDMFKTIFECMLSGGLLVTYCAKGQVRRNMIAAGFNVEKRLGPPGKREMLAAWKK
jgi:tRNA U34 5-methylaminomethyl-2-thiouridine-forming methyltransferase MnmC